MKTTFLHIIVLTTFVFSSIATSLAQPVIEASDLLNLIGQTQVQEDDTTLTRGELTPGPSGANQTWDFSNIVFENPIQFQFNYLDPANTPYADSFATANFVQQAIFTSDSGNFTSFNYSNITSNTVVALGSASPFDFFGTDTILFEFDNDSTPLPLSFGSTYSSVSVDTSESPFLPGFQTVEFDSTHTEVDAWGTVRLPIGEFTCLRLKETSVFSSFSIVNGIPIPGTGADTSVNYSWVSKDAFLVASMYIPGPSSIDETPEFTRLANTSTSISPLQDPNFRLLPSYPNPATGLQYIPYELHKAAKVAVEIFDSKGQRVTQLLNAQQAAGPHTLRWSGIDAQGSKVSAGRYYYRITVDGGSLSGSLNRL